jgi:hypothetical protein
MSAIFAHGTGIAYGRRLGMAIANSSSEIQNLS